MITYTLLEEDKAMIELALTTLIQLHDQFNVPDPKRIQYLREKIKQSTDITLVTNVKKAAK